MITGIVRNFGLFEACFYVESTSELTAEDLKKIRWEIAETFAPMMTYGYPSYKEGSYIEIGPRLSVETPESTNAVAICRAMGVNKVTRIEQSRIFQLSGKTQEEIFAKHLDKMTQTVYPCGGILDFDSGIIPEDVKIIPVLGIGEENIRRINKELGLGMDEWAINYVTGIFCRYGRNPTDVEVFQIAQGLSEHCRHGYLKAKQIIDGVEMPKSLLDLVQEPLHAISGQNVSILAFNDNVGALYGCKVPILAPINPGQPSAFHIVYVTLHPTATAETHNHPVLWSPYHGAGTKLGGRIRDTCAGGRGSLQGYGVAIYCVGNLFIPGYKIAGEVIGNLDSGTFATPLRILLEGSRGDFDYGNQQGEPQIGGGCRTFHQIVYDEQVGFIKPVFYGGGIGEIREEHLIKREPEEGMLIVAIGGPAFPIGVGGGAASSMMQGQNTSKLDLNSVQRGNGEEGNKVVRVIETCVQLGENNPIEIIHDQGAGGPSNVKTELLLSKLMKTGGKIDIRQIVLGDRTMSVLTIWSAEYQERYGLLIKSENLPLFKSICARERVNCEVLGEITDDGHVTVIDSSNNTTPVHLALTDILGKIPQKTFESKRIPRTFSPPMLPKNLTIASAIEMTFQQVSAGSKGFLVHGVDRCVGGRVVGTGQQCQGASQVPIGNVQVLADSYFGFTGRASALGEQPLKMLIDSKAGARMAIGEMLTNLMSAGGISLSSVRCRANEMFAAKLPGEGPRLYDAVEAMRDAMISLGIAADGGKDSLSMAAMLGDELVKAPGQLVIFGYAKMPDIRKVLTPDIKEPGESYLGLIDLGMGKNRLGGSALLQALNQLGDVSPDCDMKLLSATWRAIQILHDCGAILSLHDRSDGGLATTIIEMCLGGSCGANINTRNIDFLFAEELGIVLEFRAGEQDLINRVLARENAPPMIRIGKTSCVKKVFDISLPTLRKWWEHTSFELEKLQTENGIAKEEFASYDNVQEPAYELTFVPEIVSNVMVIKNSGCRPRVAVVREEGTNGDREMAGALFYAGLEPAEIHMTDLLTGQANLDSFRGIVFPGGFSFKDVFGSAKGWAGVIRFNPMLSEMFDRFYNRPDTFSFGPCNGCQLMSLLGWVPFKGLDETRQPRFIQNSSEKFESRWVQVKILPSPAIMLTSMEGSTLGVHVDHGEGQCFFPDEEILYQVMHSNLAPLVYVDSKNEATEKYPFNPNGSKSGIAGLCSTDGRHLAMMPHPERAFLKWQWHYWPESFKTEVSPWLQLFRNAYNWCMQNK